MTGQTQSNDTAPLPEPSSSTSIVPRASTWSVWALFVLCLGALVLSVWRDAVWAVPGYVVLDGLTMVMWVVISFFSGIVHSYSRRYMAGDSHVDQFYGRILAFTLVVMLMTAADHVLLFVGAWLAMGLIMASLIGHDRDWTQAQAAASLARRYFLASSALLAVGLTTLVWATDTTSITGILAQSETLSPRLSLFVAAAVFLAAIVQSALFPFQNWLLSSMTAPTPASALMHAGFVNAGGILLTRFAPLFTDDTAVLSGIVVVGAVSALLGQLVLLVQSDVKRKLGASTVAQMGFMILQCGLGFFAAAITHLILHGFYKAYLFLSSGTPVEHTAPPDASNAGLPLVGLAVSLGTALGGGVLFLLLTGKGMKLDSGAILALVVALTSLHAARDILRRSKLGPAVRLVSVPIVVMTAISIYSLTFNGISGLLSGVPMTTAPTELTVVHWVVAAGFVVAYLATELGWHRSSDRLYVALLNVSQPSPATILTCKEDYDDA